MDRELEYALIYSNCLVAAATTLNAAMIRGMSVSQGDVVIMASDLFIEAVKHGVSEAIKYYESQRNQELHDFQIREALGREPRVQQ